MPEPSRIVTKGAYAAIRGCSAPYISKLIREGKLRAPALTPEGRIDVELANAMLGTPAPQLQPIATTPGPTEDTGYAESRARREAALAERAELDLAEQRGRLVDKSAVDREIADLIRSLRDAILLIPREVAAHCAQLTDERAVEATILLALKRAMQDQAERAELPDAA